ncbi:hypothetical protein R50073_32660 [Maricurvus nonylphenolicus]|uniref:ABC transporter six-transmembrane domain-containing protein n=1 Tax=Maricurvus nonylphenolicus TaxID=1008307 RepID=UPI0036F40AD6
MLSNSTLSVMDILRKFPSKVMFTWFLVLLENLLMALIPLLIGYSIDGLLAGDYRPLLLSAAVLSGLTLLAAGRRFYDTRAYGYIRVHLGQEITKRKRDLPVSQLNARLTMGRELVDFLEEHLPELLTAVVQLVVSIAILFSFDLRLGTTAAVALIAMGLIYTLFHQRFFHGNQCLNEQMEQQVSVLETRRPLLILKHLRALNHWEIRLSDSEAILYGLIFLGMTAFILGNLVICADIPDISAGKIFTIVSYSWEFVQSAFMLPLTLQQWTRLHEITERLNGRAPEVSHDALNS